jgi:hypothetical protein
MIDIAILQMGMAIKQWISREYVEIEGARDAYSRHRLIQDPCATLQTTLEKEMEGLIWSRDIGDSFGYPYLLMAQRGEGCVRNRN